MLQSTDRLVVDKCYGLGYGDTPLVQFLNYSIFETMSPSMRTNFKSSAFRQPGCSARAYRKVGGIQGAQMRR